MNDVIIEKSTGGATLLIDENPPIRLSPQQMLDLSDDLRAFVLENAGEMEGTPLRSISVGDAEFKVVATEKPEFWRQVNDGHWEPETYAVFDRFIDADTIFLDIGAWIGSTALYAAQTAKETHAFEPDPVAFDQLKKNTDANSGEKWHKNISLHPEAVAPENGEMEMGSRAEAGDSMSSVLLGGDDDSWKVRTRSLDGFLNEKGLNGEKLFLKIDIEAGEYGLLPAVKTLLKRENCAIYLSLHPEFLLEHLRSEISGPFKELKVRTQFWRRHRRLLRSLPFEHITHVNGKPLNKPKSLVKALILGKFTHSILAFNDQ